MDLTNGAGAAAAELVSDVREDVVSKSGVDAAFGNDAMFVRVRRRKLKGAYRNWRGGGKPITASTSFDVVHAIRVDGKPRHKFLFGLGSLKTPHTSWGLARFWDHALHRMHRHDLDERRRLQLIAALLRKRVARPPPAEGVDIGATP